MKKIYDVESVVYEALTNQPETRGDNFLLYVAVLRKFTDVNKSLEEVFINHIELRIPSLETITRCRRKIQEKKPDLKDNLENRLIQKCDIMNYVKEVSKELF